MKVISCDSETSDVGPDFALIETDDSGFTLLLSRHPNSDDFGKVYYDDSKILEGDSAAKVFKDLECAEILLAGESLKIYNRIVSAVKDAI